MLIYLRHGDDRGEDVYRHDRPLNDRGRKKAAKEADRLIERYGHPDHVFVSPFRRAMETLAEMVDRFQRPVEIHRDPRIAQRLSAKQRLAPRVHPETLAIVRIDEDADSFRRRIADHVADAKHRAADSAVWCVTHQVVIETIARHFGAPLSGDLDFLDHVVVQR